MKKLMVSISVVFFILTTGCEMRTTSKQQPSNERAMSIAGSPVYEKVNRTGFVGDFFI